MMAVKVMTFATLLLTLMWNMVSGQGTTTPESPTVLKKCCPEGQTFSTQRLECKDLVYENAQLAQYETLEPALLSDLYKFSGVTDKNLKRRDYVLKSAPVGTSALPRCDNATQELTYLLHGGNDPHQADYAIRDIWKEENAMAFWLLDVREKEAYGDYCLDTGHSEATFHGTVAVFCKTRDDILCESRPCVSYCCPEKNILTTEQNSLDFNYACIGDSSGNYTRVRTFVDNDGYPVEVDTSAVREFYDHRPECERTHRYSLEKVSLHSTGKLVVAGEQLDWKMYCLERFVDLSDMQRLSSYEEGLPIIALACAPEDPYETGYLSYQRMVGQEILPIIFIISTIFLGLLFVHVYRKSRQKLFGTMTLCLITMLFCFYICLVVGQYADVALVADHKVWCLVLGLLIQYFYLSAIFWLNTMSYGIWAGFRHLRSAPNATRVTMGWQHKRFKGYAAYSWGCPLIIVIITFIVQSLPDGLVSPEFTPSIGNPRCFLAPKLAMVLYLNVIIFPLLLVNIFFFVSSMWNLCCGLWANKGHDQVVRNRNKTKFKTVVKMFFAMGIPWVAESISYALRWAYGPQRFRYLVTVFAVINGLQGVILFCAIVFDSDTVALIKQKLRGGGTKGQSNSQQPSRSHSVTKTSTRKLSLFTPKHQRPKDTVNGIQMKELYDVTHAQDERRN